MPSLLKKPSAWLPIAMSLAMLAFILIYIAAVGIVYEKDEGTPAHLFQLWMVYEFFAIAFFALTWLAREPKRALTVLALQIVAALLPVAIVFFLGY